MKKNFTVANDLFFFYQVFTELVDLLPDQDKQDELTQIHVP